MFQMKDGKSVWVEGSGGGLGSIGSGGVLGSGGLGLTGLTKRPGENPQWNNRYNLPGFQSQYDQYGSMAGGYGGRTAPQAQNSSFRNDQLGLGRQLALEAQGRGIGQQTVRMQAQNMADRGLAQQYGMAASARPGMGASAYQNAAMNAANQQAAVGGQAAQAGAQMQLGAMGQYGQFLQGARGQDLQKSQMNMDAQLRQMGLNDQAQLEALRQRLQASGMQQQGNLAFMGARNQYNMQQASQPSFGQQALGFAGGMSGGLFNMAGSGGGGTPKPAWEQQQDTGYYPGGNGYNTWVHG